MAEEYDYEEKFTEELKKIQSNSLKHKLVAIRNIVVKRLALEKEFKALHHQLEAKYETLYKPIYEKRSKVISGTLEPNVDEIKEELAKLNLNATTTNSEQGIPEFWLKCLKNSSQFGPSLNKNDEKVLSHLTDVTVDLQDDGSFTLNFYFSPNQYFDHAVLTRNFILDPHKQSISKIISTQIEWKSEDVNPTIEKRKKKIKNSKNY
jgi:hypothetical protein